MIAAEEEIEPGFLVVDNGTEGTRRRFGVQHLGRTLQQLCHLLQGADFRDRHLSFLEFDGFEPLCRGIQKVGRDARSPRVVGIEIWAFLQPLAQVVGHPIQGIWDHLEAARRLRPLKPGEVEGTSLRGLSTGLPCRILRMEFVQFLQRIPLAQVLMDRLPAVLGLDGGVPSAVVGLLILPAEREAGAVGTIANGAQMSGFFRSVDGRRYDFGAATTA